MAVLRAAGTGTVARSTVAALVAILVATAMGAAAPRTALAGELPESCRGTGDPVARADELLANRYLLGPHPIVTLPADLTWSENPLGDSNWQFMFHSLGFVLDLFAAWEQTGSVAYRDRALVLLRDWALDNPPSDPPSPWSWNDHSTALRAIVYACAADYGLLADGLRKTLVRHGEMLADPGFYVEHGNHALNQSIGLLEVGRVLGRDAWMTLARDRINALIVNSIDEQGVTDEQSVGYQTYNYSRYRLARSRLEALGLSTAAEFKRVKLMPRFIAQATLPNGQAEMLGDTGAITMPSIPGTWTEFVMSEGASGPKPPLVTGYLAGYQFARSGWGTTRAFRDETFTSVRWGPGRWIHGHADGTSLTLYAWGSRLLVDPGVFTYTSGPWRRFFVSRQAHNVVAVDGLGWNQAASTGLLSRSKTPDLVDVRLRTSGYAGVTQQRRITWSRKADYLIVEDRLTSSTRHTYRQLWHLVEGSNPVVGTMTVRTRRTRGNVLIRQLVGSPSIRVVTGRTNPIQGWISYSYGRKVAAPVAEVVASGRDVRYLTLIVPARGRPAASVSALRLTPDGYRVTITVNGRTERVVADGLGISITRVAG